MMKYIILVCDGMGDEPLAELDGRTPVEAALTPNMDRLAATGELFTLKTVPEGFAPGSDVANLSLLGYRPEEFYTGRAPLEAASMNVELTEGETAFRCNLVTLAYDRGRTAEQGEAGVSMVDYSAGHISTPEAAELLAALAAELNGPHISFHAGISYRHLMVSDNYVGGLQTTPPHDHSGADVTNYWGAYLEHPIFSDIMPKAQAILAAHPVNQSRIAKGQNPANAIWLWGEGGAPALPKMQDLFGLSGALISAVDLLKGIGKYAGMDVIDVDGATGYLDTNYQGKAEAALAALQHHDLVFVHVEAADEAGHQGLVQEKVQAIHDFDQKIVQPIMAGLAGSEFRLAITPDHFTPLALKTHVARPVPLIIYDSRGTSAASGMSYSEKNAVAADNLLANGSEFFKVLLERHE
jgi:2,3-bisphosphoglycerate-independent phosphoglycerate mutase